MASGSSSPWLFDVVSGALDGFRARARASLDAAAGQRGWTSWGIAGMRSLPARAGVRDSQVDALSRSSGTPARSPQDGSARALGAGPAGSPMAARPPPP